MNLDLIIPTHNRAGLLTNCLDSVLRATVPSGLSVTVYVVDNNSTDNTKEIVQSYAERGIRYLFVARPGKSAALNETLRYHTSGELVGLIDDDEQIDPNWFEVVYREFLSAPDLGFIGGPCLPLWEQNPPDWLPDTYEGAVGVAVRPKPDSRQYSRQQYAVGKTGMLQGGNSVIRRSVLKQALPYPETLGKIGGKIRSGEDEVIYHRMLKLGVKGLVIPDLIIHHWIPAERVTKKYYRRWVVGRGIAHGAQLRDRPSGEARLFGVPRYRFRVAAQSLITMAHWSRRKRFTAQLDILDCVAILYGFHLYI